ncbi:hypothetical protein BGZ63DRAFT_389570 [Mariannaea sp. PMI_226]|nr:hypothetical protein BGZ63DRAFT_389570 [Mariannaea sp. PMI_226]
MSDFQQATSKAGQRIARMTDLFQYIALKNPNDQEAQIRAQAADAFYSSMPGYPKRTRTEAPKELPSSADSNLKFQNKTGLSGSYLPTEILQLIVDHVENFDQESRQKTMVALSASHSTLRAITEPRLYTNPSDLDTAEKQWEFLFALKVEPRLGNLVKSLHLLWLHTGENGKLVADIVRACPNNERLVIQRGNSSYDSNKILKEDVLDLAAIFDASPKVIDFKYATYLPYSPEEERYGDMTFGQILDFCHNDSRFAKFASQLTDLHLRCQVQWVLQALSPYLSSNLTSLLLGQETLDLDFKPRFFTDLARQCPQLQLLNVACPLSSPTDLADACIMWGPSLQVLVIADIRDSTEWIPRVVPSLKALTRLEFRFETSLRDLDAISRGNPEQRFQVIDLSGLSGPEEALDLATAQAELDDSLVRLIRTHSSTLEHLDINGGRSTRVGRAVLHSCKEASRLETLYVAPPVDVESSDVDDLLETCPNLVWLADGLQSCSSRGQEWEERARLEDKEIEESVMRHPLGLGF